MADLIDIDEYKQAEGISGVKDDEKLRLLIPSISQLVKTYCGNSIIDFYSSAKTEVFSINWETDVVQLTESPVVAVSNVYERSSQADAYVELFAGGTNGKYEYYLDSATDSLFRTTDESYKYWPRGVGAVKVVYTAGYETTPEDLKLAVIDLITYYLKDEHKERRTIAGASIENVGSSSLRDNIGFPDHIKRVLDLYKNF
jgi:hypothetical protein